MPSKHQLHRYPKHVKAIGMIALETVDLEIELGVLFSSLLKISKPVGEAIYMTAKSEQARLEILKNTATALFALHPKSKRTSPKSRRKIVSKEKVLKIVSRAQTCIGKRHRAIHDEWYVMPITKEIKRLQVDGRGEVVGTPIPINQLNKEIETLRVLIDDITELAAEFDKHPPAMPSTPKRQLYKSQ
jgi:hypothetical protein